MLTAFQALSWLLEKLGARTLQPKCVLRWTQTHTTENVNRDRAGKTGDRRKRGRSPEKAIFENETPRGEEGTDSSAGLEQGPGQTEERGRPGDPGAAGSGRGWRW